MGRGALVRRPRWPIFPCHLDRRQLVQLPGEGLRSREPGEASTHAARRRRRTPPSSIRSTGGGTVAGREYRDRYRPSHRRSRPRRSDRRGRLRPLVGRDDPQMTRRTSAWRSSSPPPGPASTGICPDGRRGTATRGHSSPKTDWRGLAATQCCRPHPPARLLPVAERPSLSKRPSPRSSSPSSSAERSTRHRPGRRRRSTLVGATATATGRVRSARRATRSLEHRTASATSTLNYQAYRIHQLVAGGHLAEYLAVAWLVAAGWRSRPLRTRSRTRTVVRPGRPGEAPRPEAGARMSRPWEDPTGFRLSTTTNHRPTTGPSTAPPSSSTDQPSSTPDGADDEVLWAEGEGLIIVAPPGVGKTTVAVQLVGSMVGALKPTSSATPSNAPTKFSTSLWTAPARSDGQCAAALPKRTELI